VASREFDRGAAGARALDAADDLAGLRARFALPKDGRRALTYLCGHSLGLMPRAVLDSVATELASWAARGVEGHFDDLRRRGKRPGTGWLDYHERFSAPLAALVGARRDEVVAMNTLTVNLHLMLVSFFRPTPRRYKILIERDAFPSDRYAVQSQLRFHGLDPNDALLEIGARPGSWELDREGLDALLAAVKLAHELGNDVNALNSMGIGAIHGAANRGSDDILRYLAEQGARLDVPDRQGRTPLGWAEGVFLATHPPVRKPATIDLIQSLLSAAQ